MSQSNPKTARLIATILRKAGITESNPLVIKKEIELCQTIDLPGVLDFGYAIVDKAWPAERGRLVIEYHDGPIAGHTEIINSSDKEDAVYTYWHEDGLAALLEEVRTLTGINLYLCEDCNSQFDEDDIEREDIRHRLSALLCDTSEEKPFVLNEPFALGQYRSSGLPKDEMPKVVSLFQCQDGTIWANIEGLDEPTDIDDLPTRDLRALSDELCS